MVDGGWVRFLGWLGFPAAGAASPPARQAPSTSGRKEDARTGNWPAVASLGCALAAVAGLLVPTNYWPAPSLLLLLAAAVLGLAGRRRARRGAPYGRLATAGLASALLILAFLVIGLLVLFNAFTRVGI